MNKANLEISPAVKCCPNACSSNSEIAAVVALFEKIISFTRPDLSSASIYILRTEGTLRGSTQRNRMNFLVMFRDLELAAAMIKNYR